MAVERTKQLLENVESIISDGRDGDMVMRFRFYMKPKEYREILLLCIDRGINSSKFVRNALRREMKHLQDGGE